MTTRHRPARCRPRLCVAAGALALLVPLVGAGCGTEGEPAGAPRASVGSAADGAPASRDPDRPSDRTAAGRAPATTVVPATPLATATGAPVTPGLPPGDDTEVTRVVDGDTLRVASVGSVRLIGIDTPESVHPSKPVECFGREAAVHLASLLPVGTRVRLVYDVERTDRYDRTLAYVHRLDDGLFVNAALVRDGYALPYTVPPNVAHADEFVALAREAREASRGLWAACDDAPVGDAAAGPVVPPAAPDPAPSAGCDPSYVGACVPPYGAVGDLDCADIGAAVTVVGPDPHRLDGDGDGRACESYG
jgi:micrococcal nuclease